MRVRPLPKSWLIHDIIYYPPSQKDDWGNENSVPITVKHVRYDDSTVFSRDATQTKVLANGVVYVDAVNSHPVPDFKQEQTIKFDEKTLTIKKVVPCYQPNINEIHHYEIEVV